jgi:hypothetical protein
MHVEIVDLADLRPDPLNPRRQVGERLQAVAMSLSRFGHVLPIFADEDGIIASGHQRSEAARMLGATRVPVLRLPPGDNLLRAGRLMLFNLATNDTPDRRALTRLAEGLDLPALVGRLIEMPEVDIDDPDCWPCMRIEREKVDVLLAANPDVSLGEDGFEGPRALARPPYRIEMPLVVDQANRVVCGRQRLVAAAILERDEWPVVRVDGDTDLMALALNKLSMEYDLSGLDDILRASVWLNHNRARTHLGIGFVHWVRPGIWSNEFDILNPDDAEAWKKVHGTYVADLGAGHLIETGLLTRAGIRSVAFEPYVMDGERRPNRELTREMTRLFLAEIAKGIPFDSVFISAVLNQVPFEVDRFRLLTLAHTLCDRDTAVYITTPGLGASEWRNFKAGKRNSRFRDYDLRLPGPEPATVLSSIATGRVMVTKYHTADELRHLCSQLWRSVEIETVSASHFVRCTKPKARNKHLIRKMIEHEFNLPWGDGERLGMVDEALAAFETRLGMKL